MKNKWLVFGLILSVGINAGVFGGAALRNIKKSSVEGCLQDVSISALELLTKEIGLSTSQARDFDALRKSFEPRTNRIRENLKQKRTDLLDKLQEPEARLENLTVAINDIESLQAELQRLAVDQMLKEKAVLTPEQRIKYFALISNRLCPEGRHPAAKILPLAALDENGCSK